MTPKEMLQKALKSLGPNGEHWCKGTATEDGKCCAVRALWNCSPGDENKPIFTSALSLLQDTVSGPGSVVGFNDNSATTFADIQDLYNKAIAKAS